MTKEEALSLTPGCRVFAHRAKHSPDDEVEKVFDTFVTVTKVGDYGGDVMVDILECESSLYWDEVEFAEAQIIDDNAYEVGSLSDLFGG